MALLGCPEGMWQLWVLTLRCKARPGLCVEHAVDILDADVGWLLQHGFCSFAFSDVILISCHVIFLLSKFFSQCLMQVHSFTGIHTHTPFIISVYSVVFVFKKKNAFLKLSWRLWFWNVHLVQQKRRRLYCFLLSPTKSRTLDVKVHGILQAAASSEWLTPFRLLMLPLGQLPAHFEMLWPCCRDRAVRAVCRGCQSPRSQRFPAWGVRRMCAITVTKFLVSLLLLRCGLLNLKRKQMFHNLLPRLLQFLLRGCQLQKLMTNIMDERSDFDSGCDVSHDWGLGEAVARCARCW